MFKSLKMIASIMGVFVSAQQAVAGGLDEQRGVSLAVIEVDRIFTPRGDGLYDPILDDLRTKGVLGDVKLYSSRRARRAFKDREVGCLVPSSADMIEHMEIDPTTVLLSAPFAKARGIIVFTSHHPALTDHSLLEKLEIGIVGFQDVYGLDGPGFKPFRVSSYYKMSELLNANRLVAGYFVWPDVSAAPSALQTYLDLKDFSLPVWEEEEAFVCHRTYQGHLERISAELLRMKTEGALDFEDVPTDF